MPPKLHLPNKNVQPQPAATHSRRAVVCASEGQFQTQIDAADISELLTRPGTFVWLDLHDPQPDDLQLLRDEFGFHPLSIEDAARHHERPKLEAFDTYYFMVFYALHYMRDEQKLLSQALGLFIGANYLVSVHPGRLLQSMRQSRAGRTTPPSLATIVVRCCMRCSTRLWTIIFR